MGLRRWAGHRPQAGGDGASQDWHRVPEEGAPNRYGADRARWHTGAEYRYRRGGHELVLALHGITDLQAEAVAGGEAEFALVVEGPLPVLGYRFGAAVPWAATAPFHWQGLPAGERVVPPEVELTPASFARLWGTLWITLVEADGGRVRARRAVALSPPFTCALLGALRAQATQPLPAAAGRHAPAWPSHTPEALPQRAVCRTRCAAVRPQSSEGAGPSFRPFIPPGRRIAMSLAAEKQMEHLGETCGCADHDHDLIHELSKRLDALWRYDQRIANASGRADLQAFWRDLKRQDQENVRRLKELIGEEIQKGCF
jgi:hypothetical protein